MNTPQTAPARILTIEDESPIRDGIVAYLEDSGFTMLEANDGPSGLEIFRHEHRVKPMIGAAMRLFV